MATQADMVMAIRADVGALRQDMKQMENTVHVSTLNMSAAFGKVFKLANLATVGGSILALGRTMVNAIQAPIQEYIEFDDTMRMVAQRSQATAGDLMVLRDTAMDLGRKTSFTAQEVAGAMRNMATAGFAPHQIDMMTGSILNLARATGTDLPEAAKVASVLMRQFNMDASDMAHITDVITHASNNSMLTVEKMGTAFAKFGPVASELGVSLEEAAAGAMLLANTGAEASTIGTGLRRILTTNAAKVKELDALFGGESFADEKGRFKGLIRSFEIIDRQISGLTDVERAEKLNKAFSLLGITAATSMARGTKEMLAEYEKMRDSVEGIAAKGAEFLDEGLGGGFRRMMSAWQGLKLSIVETIEGPLADVFNGIAEKINWVTDNLDKWVMKARIFFIQIQEVFKLFREDPVRFLNMLREGIKFLGMSLLKSIGEGMKHLFTKVLPKMLTLLMDTLEGVLLSAMYRVIAQMIKLFADLGFINQDTGRVGREVFNQMAEDEVSNLGGFLGKGVAGIFDVFAKGPGDMLTILFGDEKDRITARQNFEKALAGITGDIFLGAFSNIAKLRFNRLKQAAVAKGTKLKHHFQNFLDQWSGKAPAAAPAAPKAALTAPNQVHGFGGGAGAQLGTAAGYKALLSAIHAQRKNRLDTERNRILKQIAEQNKDVEQNEGVLVAPGEG